MLCLDYLHNNLNRVYSITVLMGENTHVGTIPLNEYTTVSPASIESSPKKSQIGGVGAGPKIGGVGAGPHPWMVAGCVSLANATQFSVGYPLDTMKTWHQTGTTHRMTFTNLYRGVCLPMVASSAVSGLCFGVFDLTKQTVPDYIAGGITGVLAACFSGPVDSRKIRSQLNIRSIEPLVYRNPAKYGSPLFVNTCVRTLPYISIAAIREVPFCALYFTIQNRLRARGDVPSYAVGGVASVTAWCCTYPLDVIKTANIRAMLVSGPTNWKMEWGWKYDKGLPVSLLRVLIGGSIFMEVYERLLSGAQNYAVR